MNDDATLLRFSHPPSPGAGGERSWRFVAGLAGTAGLGLIVFLSLSAGRHARAQSTAPVSPIPATAIPTPVQAAAGPPATNAARTNAAGTKVIMRIFGLLSTKMVRMTFDCTSLIGMDRRPCVHRRV